MLTNKPNKRRAASSCSWPTNNIHRCNKLQDTLCAFVLLCYQSLNFLCRPAGRSLSTSVVPYNVLCICVWRHVIRNNEDVSRVVVGTNKTARLSDTGSVRSRVATLHHVMRVAGWLVFVNTVGMWLKTCAVCGWLWRRVRTFSGLLFFSDKNLK
jgi:hypothetical protein